MGRRASRAPSSSTRRCSRPVSANLAQSTRRRSEPRTAWASRCGSVESTRRQRRCSKVERAVEAVEMAAKTAAAKKAAVEKVSTLSPERLQVYSVFQVIDKDRSGNIEREELMDVFVKLCM